MTSEIHVGDKMRQLREQQQLTVADLADRSDCTVELLEQLEAGALAPSLAPLMRIARALGVRLGTFLDDQEQVSPVVVRAGQAESVVHFTGGGNTAAGTLDFFSLGAGKMDSHMEPFLVDVHPAGDDQCHLSSHEGEEFIYVLAGEIELCYGQETQRAGVGDSLYYDSVVPHHLHAVGGDARILAVIYTPL